MSGCSKDSVHCYICNKEVAHFQYTNCLHPKDDDGFRFDPWSTTSYGDQRIAWHEAAIIMLKAASGTSPKFGDAAQKKEQTIAEIQSEIESLRASCVQGMYGAIFNPFAAVALSATARRINVLNETLLKKRAARGRILDEIKRLAVQMGKM